MGTSGIRDHMAIYAACGTRVGIVDAVEGEQIKLTRDDPQAGGKHHFIPLSWVAGVDQQVTLDKDVEQVMREWTTEPPAGAVETAV